MICGRVDFQEREGDTHCEGVFADSGGLVPLAGPFAGMRGIGVWVDG